MQIFHNLNVNWMGKRRFFYSTSAVIILAGLLNIAFRGLNFGLDFKGGTELDLKFDKPVNITEMRSTVGKLGLGNIEVKTLGDETGLLIRSELQSIPTDLYPKVQAEIEKSIEAVLPGVPKTILANTPNSITYQFQNPDTTSLIAEKLFVAGWQAGKVSEDVNNLDVIVRIGIADWIKLNLKTLVKDNSFQIRREERVGPKVGDELKRDAVIAIALALVGILIYLGFRFKFLFASGAVAALFHDVLVTLGLYSILYGVIPGLNLDIDLTVVAAFLTLIGYSINDTVIVFDRVRETIRIHKNKDLEQLMNEAVNKTMSRTILTGGTTLLGVIVILILGGEVIRAFAFTMIIGIIAGTYSSIFVASALVLDYAKKYNRKVEF
ncbi:MAG: protein translocase subunit SecF [Ignavibacteriaceae bacterium]|nr:protein translocase subunit SecF [Ignavibacteriaceae bacterium]